MSFLPPRKEPPTEAGARYQCQILVVMALQFVIVVLNLVAAK